MNEQATRLCDIVEQAMVATERETFSGWNVRPRPEKWSKNEIFGHLVDSANNNIQRFVRATFEERFKVVYYQDQWVASQHYNGAESRDILALWALINRHIARIMERYPHDRMQILVDCGKAAPAFDTIEFLMTDYVDHVVHHLRQVGISVTSELAGSAT